MARIIAYVANRSDRLLEALLEERGAIGEWPAEQADAWGIGFYQGGEVLHKKRPYRGGDPISWKDIAGNVRSDCAIIHLRRASVGDYRAENTHPFRMRRWLFAHHGTVYGFEAMRAALIESLPDFLRRNIRGTTDSEVVFHIFLSFLHDRGLIDALDVDSQAVVSALRSTVLLIDRMSTEVGAPLADLDVALSNGRLTAVACRGAPMFYVERQFPEDGHGPPFRYVLAYGGSEAPPDYTPIQKGQGILITREIQVRPFCLA
ncbi:MAG: class II glutamine amidotransferase [Deltaproteobacteria bacterium]|nr:class II glutamine amidotransferase [Sandaracinaceae bacterium]MCX7807220.1 class II glutamine amidotransferase [Deltaproteobacteria bacterium]MDW8246008.1 class II glutamine amidotransferase [Sandaracinaceae bacterium]